MKIYQLVAYGNMDINNSRHTMHSKKIYRTEEQAEAAMPEFSKLVTTPKDKDDLTVMDKTRLRIHVIPLELVGNKKGRAK